MIELLDPKRNWSKIASKGEGPLFKKIAPLPTLTAGSAIHAEVSANLTYPLGNAMTGQTFNAKRKGK